MTVGAVQSNSLRGDVSADDVMMAMGGVTLIAGAEQQRDPAGRLLDLLMDGLTVR